MARSYRLLHRAKYKLRTRSRVSYGWRRSSRSYVIASRMLLCMCCDNRVQRLDPEREPRSLLP